VWVSLEDICKPKHMGGLGIKHLEKFNMELLGKWVWWLKLEKNKLWAKVPSSKYGEDVEKWSLGSSGLHRVSNWCRDLIKIKE